MLQSAVKTGASTRLLACSNEERKGEADEHGSMASMTGECSGADSGWQVTNCVSVAEAAYTTTATSQVYIVQVGTEYRRLQFRI